MKSEDHFKAFEEHKEAVFVWALQIKGIEKSQRIIGMHISRSIIELLSAYLHNKGLLSIGAQLNHRWFKSPRVEERLPNFKGKETVLPKLVELETISEDLAYGAPAPKEKSEKAISIFRDLEKEITGLMKNG